MTNQKKKLTEALKNTILYYNNRESYMWIGVCENKKSRKYKFEVRWFFGAEHYDHEDTLNNQIEHAETRMCESLKEAYAYGFDEIREVLQENEMTRIRITDLTEHDE